MKIGAIIIKIILAGQKTMFSLRNKRRLTKKSVNLNKYGPIFIIFPLPVMLKFTVPITAVHLFTCVAKAVTSRRSREYAYLGGPVPVNDKFPLFQICSTNFSKIYHKINKKSDVVSIFGACR